MLSGVPCLARQPSRSQLAVSIVQAARLAFLILLLPGCSGTVHPLLSEQDLLKDSDLSGKWTMEVPGRDKQKHQVPLTLKAYDTSTYDLTFPQDQAKTADERMNVSSDWPDTWRLQIGKINGELFAQVTPEDLPPGPPVTHGIPVYWFGRIELTDDTIKFYPILDTACATLAEREKLQHVSFEPSAFVELTIFTMPTAELQKLVIKHGQELFSPEPMVLRRTADKSR